ncbi:MAG: N-acetylmuramoyl-L-alanine amidase [Desulfobacteraceae bacterium]|nr:N-acetylmuramoyl-L-alanine amidase [Desulfobacteraceae bacterium]
MVLTELMVFNRSRRLVFFISVVLFLTFFSQRPAWPATTQSKYYTAERCAAELHKNPSQQKHRDRWLTCVQKYLAVYRDDPHGAWAAAGMYQAGILYSQLYKRSNLEEDKRQALDLLDNVVKYYPSSRYRNQAQAAADQLRNGNGRPAPTPTPAPEPTPVIKNDAIQAKAKQWYDKGQANDQHLEKKPELKKHRDQWFKSIDAYRKAYQADPQGELAPAALYGMGKAYEGMYKRSHIDLDRIQSQKSFEELASEFPQSPFAAKVQQSKEGPPPESAKVAGDDKIAEMIQETGPDAEAAAASGSPSSSHESSSSQGLSVVNGLRFWSTPRYTRVVIDANADTEFSHRQLREDPGLGKPQRIYIDIHNSRLSSDFQKVVPINDNLLSDARAGQYNADTVRVVVDIKSSKTYKIFSLKNPFRLVLDVWGQEVATATAPPPPPPEEHTSSGKIPQSAIVKQLALGVKRIVIDPGHGGKDFGAPGAIRGVHEKQVTLEIGRRLAEKIRSQLKCDVVMTRNSDTYLSLEERTAIANTQNADLFISIHTNAAQDHQAYGMETYILNLATDDESIRVAARENATSTKNISDLDSILQDLMQNAKVNESTRLAGYVQIGAYSRLGKKFEPLRNKGVKKAPFYVLLGADMPSILVETAFISNPRECQRLTSPEFQDVFCQGIVDGIKHYIEDNNPMALSKHGPGKG